MKRLYRSSDEKMIAGVCAGLAHRFDLNTNVFFSGVPAVAYAVFWSVLKQRSTDDVIDID